MVTVKLVLKGGDTSIILQDVVTCWSFQSVCGYVSSSCAAWVCLWLLFAALSFGCSGVHSDVSLVSSAHDQALFYIFNYLVLNYFSFEAYRHISK